MIQLAIGVLWFLISVIVVTPLLTLRWEVVQ